LTSTGFKLSANANYEDGNTKVIYIAIRRPMKPPTTGTEVFAVAPRSSTAGYEYAFVSNFPVDMGMSRTVIASTEMRLGSRLQGNAYLETPLTTAEVSSASWYGGDSMNSASLGFSKSNESPVEKYGWMFKRAPGFFDVVCYTGTGTNGQTFNHNLTVAPELMIVKKRSTTDSWFVGSGFGASTYRRLLLNSTGAGGTATYGSGTVDLGAQPTATTFSLGTETRTNGSGSTYVAYLFATVAGVSKVGTYTGTGTTNAINCGFSGGARFVLIKRTDATASWYVWDTARGIVSGNDPYLLLNTTDAEVTSTDYIDPSSSGFEISSSAPAAINASGGTYLFLAIA
jgi:hypothetical protein